MLAVWQATIIDTDGKPTAGATVEVRDEESSSLVTIYEDSDGLTVKDNPFTASEAFVRFYVANGVYRIKASKDGYETEWRNVVIGYFATEDYVDTESAEAEANAKAYTDSEVYDVAGEVTALGVDVELNKEIWKDQDGVEHKLWISEEEPDDEYDGEDGDIWFVREETVS